MGSITDHVSIVITADSVSVARAGFGVPLIASCNATFLERTRTYTSLAGMAADGFATDSPEYLAAGAIFGQSPRPPRLKIGRLVGAPTQRYSITVGSVQNLHEYVIHVKGEGVTTTSVTFTSDASATDAEIVAGLVTALNAVTGNNYIAAGASSPFTVTGDAAGDWFSLEVDNTSDLSITQDHAEPSPTLATDLNNIVLEDDAWYWLITLYNSTAYVAAAADWVESVVKFYVGGSNDSRDILTVSDGDNGTLDALKTEAYTRTHGFYHPDPSSFADAALVGNLAPRTVGEWTAKFKRLAGVAAVELTPTQRGNLIARNANSYETVAGVNITFEGTTAAGPSVLRGFVDNVVNLDWVQDDMSAGIFAALAGAAKIPRTDAGMVAIESPVRATLDRGIQRSIIAEDPSYVVDVPLVADMDDLLPRGVRLSFSFTLAGAIHNADVTGVVIL